MGKQSSTPVIHLIAAARPNFMKVAPLYHALRARELVQRCRSCTPASTTTPNMSDAFFRDLDLPRAALPSRRSAAAAMPSRPAA